MKIKKKSKMSPSSLGNQRCLTRQSAIGNRQCKMGLTLVEVLMSVLLVGAGAAFIYSGSMYSYKTMMRSRARLSAQGIAFDKLWAFYNLQTTGELLVQEELEIQWEPTPERSAFGTNGAVEWVVQKVSGKEAWNIKVWVYAYPSEDSYYNSDTNNTPYCTNDLATILFPAGRDPVMAESMVRRSNRMR